MRARVTVNRCGLLSPADTLIGLISGAQQIIPAHYAGSANIADVTAQIRPADVSDAPRLADVHVAAWRETYGTLLSKDVLSTFDIGKQTAAWETLLGTQRDPLSTFVVAEIDGALVGFATAGPPRHDNPARDWVLASLYTLSSVHGHGVGTALLDAVVGARPTELWVAAENPRACAFYRKHGFTDDGTTNWFAPWHIMEKRMVR